MNKDRNIFPYLATTALAIVAIIYAVTNTNTYTSTAEAATPEFVVKNSVKASTEDLKEIFEIRESETEDLNTTYIYIGDSRTVGLNNAVNLENQADTYVIAKVGQGYNWWTETGKNELSKIKSEHPEYNDYIYIFNLGVNDPGNASKYETVIDELLESGTVYIVSINPVVDSKSPYIKNSDIEKINKVYINTAATYIDTNTILTNAGFSSPDGIHYSDDTYNDIYNIIQENIKSEE